MSKNLNNKSNYISFSYDKTGKKQYTYDKEFVKKASNNKFKRIVLFANSYNYLYNYVKRKLNEIKLNEIKLNEMKLDKTNLDFKDFQCLIMIWILLKTYIRVGNTESDTYGLTTLLNKHVILEKDINGSYYVILDFIGKKRVRNYKKIKDPLLYKYFIGIKKTKRPNEQLFTVSNNELNLHLKSLIGSQFTCKDIRTYSANKLFINYLINQKTLKGSYEYVAKELCNTKYISKKSYIMNSISNLFKNKPDYFNNSTSVNDILQTSLRYEIKS